MMVALPGHDRAALYIAVRVVFHDFVTRNRFFKYVEAAGLVRQFITLLAVPALVRESRADAE